MMNVSEISKNIGTSYENYSGIKNEQAKSAKAEETAAAGKKNYISGKTIGKPKLSAEAEKYYEELKKKFSDMDFILVSEDMKAAAKANASAYAQAGKMVVLVDENKIEQMAKDEKFRAQYEGLISKAAAGFSQFSQDVEKTGANVKGYGMQVNNNGTVSLFAVLEKSSKAQADRIEANREKAKAEKKAEAKKAEKEAKEERLQKNKEAAKETSKAYNKDKKVNDDSEDIVITAGSWEELIRKIEDYVQADMSDSVISDGEKLVGQSIDFSV